MLLAQQKLCAQHNEHQDSMMEHHWWLTNNEHHLNPKTILSTDNPSCLRLTARVRKVNIKKIVDNTLVNGTEDLILQTFWQFTKINAETLLSREVKLLASVDISTRAPWITQNEQHFVAG
jgi:hypothetical protein